jgi:hypothetical protein
MIAKTETIEAQVVYPYYPGITRMEYWGYMVVTIIVGCLGGLAVPALNLRSTDLWHRHMAAPSAHGESRNEL